MKYYLIYKGLAMIIRLLNVDMTLRALQINAITGDPDHRSQDITDAYSAVSSALLASQNLANILESEAHKSD